MSGRVWFPEKSVPEGEDEGTHKAPQDQSEKQEKRKSSKITRRTTPTVDVSALDMRNARGAKSAAAEEEERQNYSTIEKSSYRRNAAALECSSGQPLTGGTDFCGWETNRKQPARQGLAASSSLSRKCAADRSSLSTPADGYRSGVPSRACSRAGGRRKGNGYVFQHLSDARRYIEDYCKQCSFTALNVPHVDSAIREAEGEKVRERTQGGEKGGESRCHSHSGGRQTSRDSLYLQLLASRLGVRESIQLLPRPTPPSIAKKNRAPADLLVCSKEDTPAVQEEELVQRQTVERTSEPLSAEQGPEEPQAASSRSVSASNGRPQSTITPLELPRIPQRVRVQDKTLSTTSVSKYLRISSHAQHSLSIDLGEEESAAEAGSHGSGVEILPSTSGCALVEESSIPAKESTVLGPESHGGSVGGHSISVSPPGLSVGSRDLQPALFDEVWRNRVLTQKAQALGLLSRGWARATHTKRIAGGYDSKVTSRPPTREMTLSRPPTRAHPHTESPSSTRDTYTYTKDIRTHTGNTRPPTRDTRPPTRDCHQPSPSTRETSTKQATREAISYRHSLSKQPTNTHSNKKDDDKLEQLQSIYKPPSASQTGRQSRRSHSRLQHDRCERHSTSRRPAGGSTHTQRGRERKTGHFSRPATRTGRKLEPSLPPHSEAEESQYWNEVAQGGQEQPQFQVRNGMQLRVESQSITRGRQTPIHMPRHTDQQYKYSRTNSQPPILLTGRRRTSIGSVKPGPIAGQIASHTHHQQTQQKIDSFLGIAVTSNM